MKRIGYYLLLAIGFCFQQATAQHIHGNVYEETNGSKNPLPGVSVYWIGTTIGTLTDEEGAYHIEGDNIKDKRLIFSFIGFKTDTIHIKKQQEVNVILRPGEQRLNEVVIKDNSAGTYISKLDPRKTQVITKDELFRAACCNLSESFETNASIDVAYSDAISGAKQIQLLGLSGTYGQILTENVPMVSGLATTFGLNYIPGPWMEGIQISKGTSSVTNGFEAITGQINVEYKKPTGAEKLHLNLFADSKERYEFNMTGSHRFTKDLSSALFFHYSDSQKEFDKNNDLFMDVPRLRTINVLNRWDLLTAKRLTSHFTFKYLEEKRDGGFMDFKKASFTEDTAGISDLNKPYGLGITTRRAEAYLKNGLLFPDKPYKSVALVLAANIHDQDGFFGLNRYEGIENRFYANLIYQSQIGSEHQKFTTGLSFKANDLKETYYRRDFTYLYQLTGSMDDLFKLVDYRDTAFKVNDQEIIPGAFFEYTQTFKDVFTLIAGIRADHHNTYGTLITPRLHIRYQPTEKLTIRASAGKGYRKANIFAENYSIMASQRKIYFMEELKMEDAWNYGLNFTYDFKIQNFPAQFDVEYYHTTFINQVIVDMDADPASVYLYNLDGKSWSNSYQAQLSFEPVKRLKTLVAFRVNDVKSTINNTLQERPFTNIYKGLVTLSYILPGDRWQLDLTSQFNGPTRIPDTKKMPAALQRDTHSPAWTNILGQVTYRVKRWEIYVGGENLLNFTQKDPITEAWAPYHTHFDTSMVWGPIVGAKYYSGIRYTIK